MSKLVGDCYIIQEEDPVTCDECKVFAECRLVGTRRLCFTCGQPEVAKEIEKAKFCLQVPKGVKVTEKMIEQARQKAFG